MDRRVFRANTDVFEEDEFGENDGLLKSRQR